MRKALFVVVGALVASMLFSGCFVMRTLVYTKDKIEPGEKTKAKVTLNGDTTAMVARGVSTERPFFLYLVEGDLKLQGGVFDKTGVFDGPVDLVKNEELVTQLEVQCEGFIAAARQGPITPLTALTTEDPFEATAERKIIEATLDLKAPPDAESGAALAIFGGSWHDDGDDVPEDEDTTDDSYDCQPPYISTLFIKGAGGPAP